jgi:hypothetical protein
MELKPANSRSGPSRGKPDRAQTKTTPPHENFERKIARIIQTEKHLWGASERSAAAGLDGASQWWETGPLAQSDPGQTPSVQETFKQLCIAAVRQSSPELKEHYGNAKAFLHAIFLSFADRLRRGRGRPLKNLDRDIRIRAMREAGLPLGKISNRTGMSKAAVSAALRRYEMRRAALFPQSN